MVPQNSPIHTAADLTGKTVGIAGLKDLSHFSASAWINQNGGDYRTVHFIELPFPQMPSALRSGRVDAAVLAEPFMNAAKSFARELGNQQAAVGEKYLAMGWVAREDWAKQNPEAARRLISVFRQTAIWANSRGNESAEILRRFTKISPRSFPASELISSNL